MGPKQSGLVIQMKLMVVLLSAALMRTVVTAVLGLLTVQPGPGALEIVTAAITRSSLSMGFRACLGRL